MISPFLILIACGGASDMSPTSMEAIPDRFVQMEMEESADDMAYGGGELKKAERGRAKGAPAPAAPAVMAGLMSDEEAPMEADKNVAGKKDAGGAADGGVATRTWFPETFLWAPRVVTDASGKARIPVTLPDSLTTWRVLGLAASKDARSGAVVEVDTRLPVYTEPRVPPFLRQGDVVSLPVQVFNASDAQLTSRLTVRAVGLDGGSAGPVSVAPGGRALETTRLTATGPGAGSVEVVLEGADAVVRELSVLPRGRKTSLTRVGVLGAGDRVSLASPAGSTYARARLTVYPGPLGVLRDAMAGAPVRLYTAEDRIFAIALSSRGAAALTAMGVEVDEADTRKTRILAAQGLVREITGGDLHRQLTLIDGLSGASDDPVIERMLTWARDEATRAQLPDGTWAVPNGSGLQQLLALTAHAAGVLDDERARVVASGAFERNAAFLLEEETTDAYTAALVLNSGACPAELQEPLRAIVAEAVEKGEDGLWTLSLPTGVLRPDGRAVGEAERLAAAALALEDEDTVRNLLASLVARYSPGRGFTDARTGLAALAAFEGLASSPPAGAIEVALKVDGEVVGRQSLDPRAEQTFVIAAPVGVGEHDYEVVSEGAWPGMAWHVTQESWAPWGERSETERSGVGVQPGGLEVQVERGPTRAWQPVEVTVTASGPRGARIDIVQELPVGLTVDADTLPADATADDRAVRATVTVGEDGLATLRYTATPTFAGQLWSGATTATARGVSAFAPPERWTIR